MWVHLHWGGGEIVKGRRFYAPHSALFSDEGGDRPGVPNLTRLTHHFPPQIRVFVCLYYHRGTNRICLGYHWYHAEYYCRLRTPEKEAHFKKKRRGGDWIGLCRFLLLLGWIELSSLFFFFARNSWRICGPVSSHLLSLSLSLFEVVPAAANFLATKRLWRKNPFVYTYNLGGVGGLEVWISTSKNLIFYSLKAFLFLLKHDSAI